MIIAIDFGITNTDVALSNKSQYKFFSIPSKNANESFIYEIISLVDIDITEISQIVVTGGKSNELNESFKGVNLTKISETDAIGYGTKEIYKIENEPFITLSCGTGTACIHHQDGQFSYVGGIAVGGGTISGLSKAILDSSSLEEITDLALKGNRKNIDLLIGDVVNEIGILNSNVTASNFAKLKDSNIFSKEDMSHSILNMVGEIIGTIGYLNAGLFGINNIHFLGRVSLNKVVKNSILERLKLANIKGLFEDNREYGTVIGALKLIETK